MQQRETHHTWEKGIQGRKKANIRRKKRTGTVPRTRSLKAFYSNGKKKGTCQEAGGKEGEKDINKTPQMVGKGRRLTQEWPHREKKSSRGTARRGGGAIHEKGSRWGVCATKGKGGGRGGGGAFAHAFVRTLGEKNFPWLRKQ